MDQRVRRPNAQPRAKCLSKLDLGLSIYELISTSVFMIVLWQSPSTVHEYVNNTPGQEDFVNFFKFDEEKQWTILYIFLGWYCLELFLSIIFFRGSRSKNINLLRTWLILTVLDCLVGLGCCVPVFEFTTYKGLFFIIALIVYCYKLFCIYVVTQLVGQIRNAANRRSDYVEQVSL